MEGLTIFFCLLWPASLHITYVSGLTSRTSNVKHKTRRAATLRVLLPNGIGLTISFIRFQYITRHFHYQACSKLNGFIFSLNAPGSSKTRQIPLTGIGQHRHQSLACIFRSRRHLHGSPTGSAGRNAD